VVPGREDVEGSPGWRRPRSETVARPTARIVLDVVAVEWFERAKAI
jgi:hypothetical protein